MPFAGNNKQTHSMKKSFILSLLCAIASLLPAQKEMYIWQNASPSVFPVSVVDSVTFSASARLHVWRNNASTDFAYAAIDSITFAETPFYALHGVFSVSETKKVRFSAGNLQYIQSTKTWSFAGHQYDFIGEANIEDGALADKIDLFGWSGSTGSAKWGISTSTDNGDYAGDFADWGKNLSDGGTWRTLSSDEWRYIFEQRTNADNLWSRGSINGVNGLIILPDNFEQPADITWTAKANNWTTNAYNLTQWAALESLGAVFLPAAGRRSQGGTIYNVQDYGYYWSSSFNNTAAYHIQFLVSDLIPEYLNGRCNGNSVRLVQDL